MTMAKDTSLATLAIAAETALTIILAFDVPLLGLLSAATCVWQSCITCGFLAILLVVDEIPPLGEVSAKVLHDRPGQRKGNV
jgi:hypothetical protein